MKFKFSNIALFVMALLGVAPLGVGVYNANTAPQEYASSAPAEPAPYSTDNLEDFASPAGPSLEEHFSQIVTDVPTMAQEVVETKPDWVATFGAINTVVAGWFAWFFRKREKVEENIKQLRLEMGDLRLMPLKELFSLLWKSTHSLTAIKRLMFRMNHQFSIYGFSHTSMVPKVPGRPIQFIDRRWLVRSPGWILEDFEDEIHRSDWFTKERSLTGLVRAWSHVRARMVGFMQDDENSVKVDYSKWLEEEDWRTDGTHSHSPKAVSAELDNDEIGIMLFFKRTDGEDAVYTLLAKDTEIPETLEQWEDFVMAFCRQNASLLKEDIILSIVAIHKPVV